MTLKLNEIGRGSAFEEIEVPIHVSAQEKKQYPFSKG
jgi:hypothetical protein